MADMTRRVVLELLARNRAAGEMASFNRGLDNVYRSARRVAVGLLAAAGVGGLGYMIKRQMEAIDTTAKLSDRLGMGTEALIGLQHAAGISGIEQETLNKSLEIFSRRLGEVDMGVGQAKYALDKLGLSYKDLIGKSPEEAIGVIADQINKLETQAEKAAAANYLFGRSGQQLLTLFAQGSVGIELMRKEAEKLGLTFSRFDASQVEAANDALTRARGALTGLFRQATIELVPYIEALADKFTDVATSGEGMGAKVVDVFEMMSLAAVKFGSAVQMVGIRHKQWSAATLEGLAKSFEVLEILDNIAPAIKGMEILFKRKAGVGFGEFAESLHESAEEWKTEVIDLENETRKRGSSIEKFYDDLRKKAAEAGAAARAGTAAGAGGWTVEAAPAWFDTTDELQKRLAKEAQIKMDATAKINDRIAEMTLDTHDYKLRLLEEEIDKYRQAGVQEERIAELKNKSIEDLDKQTSETAKKSSYDIAAAYSRMYNEIDSKSAASFEARRQLLMEEYEVYEQTIEKEAALNEWLADQQIKLAIDQAKATGGLVEGFGAGIAEMQRDMRTIGELGYELAKTFSEDLVEGLNDALWKVRDLDDAMKDVRMTMAKMATQWLLQQAVINSMAGIGGLLGIVPVAHGGGDVGRTNFPKRMVDPAVFARAPRFHEGLAPDERPAIVQVGERILSREEVSAERSGFGLFNTSALESKLDTLIGLMSQRQIINATIVDKRDLVTSGQMEGRDGEKWTMNHVQRNR